MIKSLLITTALLTSAFSASFSPNGIDMVKEMTHSFQVRKEVDLIGGELRQTICDLQENTSLSPSYKRTNINIKCQSLVESMYHQVGLYQARVILDAFNSRLITEDEAIHLSFVSFEPNYIWSHGQLRGKNGHVYYEFKG